MNVSICLHGHPKIQKRTGAPLRLSRLLLAHGIARKDPVPRLSILIPSLDGDFEDTLASVLQHRPDDAEVIVSHGCPYDDPYRLDGEVCFVARPNARQRVHLMNAGFEAARSRVVHVVQPGIRVADGWTDVALERFEKESVASVSPIIVADNGSQRIVSAGQGYSRTGRVFAHAAGRQLSGFQPRKQVIGPTIAGGFYRRSWWRLVRWDEAVGDNFADAHFNLTVAALGGHAVLEPGCVMQDVACRRLAADVPYGFFAALQAEQLFWSHTQQPRTMSTIAMRAFRMLGEAILALPSPRCTTGLLGRIKGLFSTAQIEVFRSHLLSLADRLAAQQAESDSSATLSLTAERRRRAKPPMINKQAA